MRRIPFRSRAEQRGLRLWHVWIVLPLAFITAITTAAVVLYVGWDLLGVRELKPQRSIDSKTLFELVKLSFGVVAGAGALVALVVAYRRQRVDEDGALRDATRLHTERFTAAVSQLGDASAAVRLGGVHALAGLADDAPTRALRQTCIDVLCAYLRLPYTAETDLPPGDTDARHTYLGLREVRRTITRLIRDHLRLPLAHPRSWQGHDFDFTDVAFDGADFSEAHFSSGTVSFNDARFTGTVNFRDAKFSGADVFFIQTEFSANALAFFGSAWFTGGKVSFLLARFTGGLGFGEAKFDGATVSFHQARFDSSLVDFHDAWFASGTVTFRYVSFPATGVAFTRARFAGGEVDFSEAIGTRPNGLPPSGTSLPTGLTLPPNW